MNTFSGSVLWHFDRSSQLLILVGLKENFTADKSLFQIARSDVEAMGRMTSWCDWQKRKQN
jgi:hypothetical protein